MASVAANEYKVLARKYRPSKLSELIGQEALVRTLTNAIESSRIPHAFILTGIRGVGKTSTARIIARSLVCIGEDGKNDKPTLNPCGVCEQCRAIAEDRHVDILEIDAASHTGVDEMRQIIDNVNYLPVMARYRIYVIDEVHMLSRNAFNALLKTLEEPPPHAKFIFATTEIRKIPVTILSRCMRFDLHRIDAEVLTAHLKNIAEKESANFTTDALALISHTAEGSVRDALSLMDQAIGSAGRSAQIARNNIQEMLGLADRSIIFDIFEQVISGKPDKAITALRESFRAGANPVTVLQDLLEISHFVSLLKTIPALENAEHIAENERSRGKLLADKLSIPLLARIWQMLIKGISEAQVSPNSLMAAEMILIRLSHVSDSPPPGDLLKDLRNSNFRSEKSENKIPAKENEKILEPVSQLAAPKTVEKINPLNFKELVAIFHLKGENFVYNWLQEVYPVSFNPKSRSLTFRPEKTTPSDLASKVSELLGKWTGDRWIVAVSREGGGKSLRQEKDENMQKIRAEVEKDEVVQAIFAQFPSAMIKEIEKIEDLQNSPKQDKEVETDRIPRKEERK